MKGKFVRTRQEQELAGGKGCHLAWCEPGPGHSCPVPRPTRPRVEWGDEVMNPQDHGHSQKVHTGRTGGETLSARGTGEGMGSESPWPGEARGSGDRGGTRKPVEVGLFWVPAANIQQGTVCGTLTETPCSHGPGTSGLGNCCGVSPLVVTGYRVAEVTFPRTPVSSSLSPPQGFAAREGPGLPSPGHRLTDEDG